MNSKLIRLLKECRAFIIDRGTSTDLELAFEISAMIKQLEAIESKVEFESPEEYQQMVHNKIMDTLKKGAV